MPCHNARKSAVRTLAALSAAGLPIMAGCVQPAKIGPYMGADRVQTVDLVANPGASPSESRFPLIGHVDIATAGVDYWFVTKGRTNQGGTLPYRVGLETAASVPASSLSLPSFVAAFITGRLGSAHTTTVGAYAPAIMAPTGPSTRPTEFAIVTDTFQTTYVVHINHGPDQTVEVRLLKYPAAPAKKLDDNEYIVVQQNDQTLGSIHELATDPLPPDVDAELQALMTIRTTAGVP